MTLLPLRCLSVLVALSAAACTTLPGGRRWGEDAAIAPGWPRVRESAVRAARDPWVWAPLAGAAAMQVDDWDRKVSDWAQRNTPVFGSQANATKWSDDLRSTSVVTHAVTVLLTPSGDSGSAWAVSKVKGYAVQLVAATTAIETTTAVKNLTKRTRPNGLDDDSFPSGHATTSAVYTTLASRNLDEIEMDRGARDALRAGLQVINFGTAWARIEGGWHYPSDTLAGIALGNFCGMFFNDAFMGLDASRARVAFAPLAGGGEILWQVGF